MFYYKAFLIFYYIYCAFYFSTIFYQNKINKKLDIGLRIFFVFLSLILSIIIFMKK